ARPERRGFAPAVSGARPHPARPRRAREERRPVGRRRARARHGDPHRAAAALVRIQAPPGPAGGQADYPQLRARPALSDHPQLPERVMRPAALAVLVVLAGCSQASDRPQPAPSTPIDLVGEYRVAGIDGAPLDGPEGIALTITEGKV